MKKFNEGHMELHGKVQLDWLSDSVNEETCRIASCLLDNNHHLPISDLHHEIAAQYMYVNVSRAISLPNINERAWNDKNESQIGSVAINRYQKHQMGSALTFFTR